MHKIAEDLLSLAQPIELLDHLEGNPRRGNVAAIKASYDKFGQVKPLVGVRTEDGRITILSGNHQLRAAKELGWAEVAVTIVDMSPDDAIAYALADNRTSELGHTDPSMLYDMLDQVNEPEFFEVLGWDDFEMASMEFDATTHDTGGVDLSGGYIAPQLKRDDEDDEDLSFEGDEDTVEDIVTRGATAGGAAGAKALVQYTILFEDESQQKEWYDFLRWVKEQPEVKDAVTARQIIWFIREFRPTD